MDVPLLLNLRRYFRDDSSAQASGGQSISSFEIWVMISHHFDQSQMECFMLSIRMIKSIITKFITKSKKACFVHIAKPCDRHKSFISRLYAGTQLYSVALNRRRHSRWPTGQNNAAYRGTSRVKPSSSESHLYWNHKRRFQDNQTHLNVWIRDI